MDIHAVIREKHPHDDGKVYYSVFLLVKKMDNYVWTYYTTPDDDSELMEYIDIAAAFLYSDSKYANRIVYKKDDMESDKARFLKQYEEDRAAGLC